MASSESEQVTGSHTSDVRTESGDVDVEQAPVDKLKKDALSLQGVLFACVAAIAPAASMLFNIPVMASQAGAATPLVFLIASIAVLLLGLTVVYFSRRLSSAGGLYTWVRHGLGPWGGFLVGWIMFGAYGLFEVALQTSVGGSLDNLLSPLGFHLFGGWVTYAVMLTLLVGILSYVEVTWAVWVMAPFAVAEVIALLILDMAITMKGGASGQDLVHTFTPAGAMLAGATPGSWLGLGMAMVLGILAFVGFETGAVYGEEAKRPHRTIPLVIFSLIIGLCVLYTWTAYAATIGFGWQRAVEILGNVNTAPTQFITLANRFVGIWLGVGLTIFVLTSNAASACAMHQVMVRYLYAMGREGPVFPLFGKTHPRWKSPHWAILAQSSFTLLMILLLGLVIQRTDAQGNTFYSFGWASTIWQQTNGITVFGWLASVVTMLILVVYILANVALPCYARSQGALQWRVKALIPGILFPAVSTCLLLLPLGSYLLPAVPGPVGTFFTHLGFSPTPFPSNLLPLVVLAWIVGGMIYFAWMRRRAPEVLEKLGRIIRVQG